MSKLKKLFSRKLTKPEESRANSIRVFPSGGSKKRWYYHVVAGNGEIVTASEGYSTKSNAVRAARKLFPELEIETFDSAPKG